MEGHIYHLLNRGVEKRDIFLSDRDRIRFIDDMKDFNSPEHTVLPYYRRRRLSDVARPTEQLVHVLCWALMSNHPHILVMERTEGTVSAFSRKVFGGYTKYFNEKYERSGVLFQGRSKIIRIKRDAHLMYLPFYIHLNPLDLFQTGWKEEGIKDVNGALHFLETYRWSNYRNIISGNDSGEFADVTDKQLFFDLFQTSPQKYKKDFEDWVRDHEYRVHDFIYLT